MKAKGECKRPGNCPTEMPEGNNFMSGENARSTITGVQRSC